MATQANQASNCHQILTQRLLLGVYVTSAFSNRIPPASNQWEELRKSSTDRNEWIGITKTCFVFMLDHAAHCEKLIRENRFSGPLKGHCSDVLLHFHKVGLLRRDRFEKEWAKSKQWRPRYPDFWSAVWVNLQKCWILHFLYCNQLAYVFQTPHLQFHKLSFKVKLHSSKTV